ncbi:MAG: LysR family transcriptional regulator [Rhodobacterales bacterium]|nr:LysR family transcriptional regulator [Rhodobacterales bacterium]
MGKGEVVIVPEFDGARPREPAEVTLRKLQAFWAVAHAGSLTRAARLMGVTQPSLSQQMAGFEALAGSPLLDGRSNVMHLTEVGRRLLDRAEPVLRALRDFETELASLQGAPRTMLRIAGIGSAITMLVPGAAAVLAETCASPEYDLVEASPSDVLELLNVRRADLGLVAANSLAENAKGFKEVAILSDQHFLAATSSPATITGNCVMAGVCQITRHIASTFCGDGRGGKCQMQAHCAGTIDQGLHAGAQYNGPV